MRQSDVVKHWHDQFSNAEKVVLFDAVKFCNQYRLDLLADINNEKAPRHSETELNDHVLRGVPYMYKDFIIGYCAGGAA